MNNYVSSNNFTDKLHCRASPGKICEVGMRTKGYRWHQTLQGFSILLRREGKGQGDGGLRCHLSVRKRSNDRTRGVVGQSQDMELTALCTRRTVFPLHLSASYPSSLYCALH